MPMPAALDLGLGEMDAEVSLVTCEARLCSCKPEARLGLPDQMMWMI